MTAPSSDPVERSFSIVGDILWKDPRNKTRLESRDGGRERTRAHFNKDIRLESTVKPDLHYWIGTGHFIERRFIERRFIERDLSNAV